LGKYDYGFAELHRKNLKFVSCGKPGKGGLAFEQLTSIFDIATWVAVATSLVTMAMFLNWVVKIYSSEPAPSLFQGKLKTKLTSCVKVIPDLVLMSKVLFEQGGPISNSYLKCSNLRFALAPFLLMALILSNAYKNENVTKITLPLTLIPVNTFDKLVNYNFTLFTRVVFTGGFKSSPSLQNNFFGILYQQYFSNTDVNSKQGPRTVHDAPVYPSELFFVISLENHFLKSYEGKLNLSSQIEAVLNYTQIHPLWDSMLKFGKPSYSEVLKGCNNTALFLSDVDAQLTFFELRRNLSIKQNVFLSKESMFQVQYKYSIGRWTTPTIMYRLGSLDVGGFFNWWTHLIVEYMTKMRGGETADKPKQRTDLSGNISVIFIVLASGLCYCLVVFAFEIRRFLMRVLLEYSGALKKLPGLVIGLVLSSTVSSSIPAMNVVRNVESCSEL